MRAVMFDIDGTLLDSVDLHAKACVEAFAHFGVDTDPERVRRQIGKADIIVVGDTPYDAEAASKAGLSTIGVLRGGFPEDDLSAAGCIALYRDPHHLLDAVDQSPLVSRSDPSERSSGTPLYRRNRAFGAPIEKLEAALACRGLGDVLDRVEQASHCPRCGQLCRCGVDDATGSHPTHRDLGLAERIEITRATVGHGSTSTLSVVRHG